MPRCAAVILVFFLSVVALACAGGPSDAPATAEERAREARCLAEEPPGTAYFNSVCVQLKPVAARLRFESLARCAEGPTTEYQRGVCQGLDPPPQGGTNPQQAGR